MVNKVPVGRTVSWWIVARIKRWALTTMGSESGDGIPRVVCTLAGEMFIPVIGVKK